ncbi:hypothetical protein [Anabaena azotica]|uniref:TPM domain-containing protein n=1 Tax=Anabaena azotica FACHB-119 TaxID=947527 RepID=A0ABR8DDB3_9NOST|nr:hypothetical protein [Anabaena azotica]MBD2505064.1 hypothetical protein [Anabaena azotica FACHB-119]
MVSCWSGRGGKAVSQVQKRSLPEPVEKSVQPSQQEVQDVLQQLREIPCTPQFRLNWEIQQTLKPYWQNIPGAIAYLKEALRTGKGVKSPEAVFVVACKEGRKPESAQVKSAVKDWFEWAYKQRIVIAMSGEVVYTRLGGGGGVGGNDAAVSGD